MHYDYTMGKNERTHYYTPNATTIKKKHRAGKAKYKKWLFCVVEFKNKAVENQLMYQFCSRCRQWHNNSVTSSFSSSFFRCCSVLLAFSWRIYLLRCFSQFLRLLFLVFYVHSVNHYFNGGAFFNAVFLLVRLFTWMRQQQESKQKKVFLSLCRSYVYTLHHE